MKKTLIIFLVLFLWCGFSLAGNNIIIMNRVLNNQSTGSLTTYGATSTGASGRFEGGADTIAYSRAGAGKLVVSSSGTLTKIGGYFTSTSGSIRNAKLGLYTDDGADGPYLLVTGTEVELDIPANATDEQVEYTLSVALDAGTYHIGYVPHFTGTGVTYDAGAAGDRPRVTLTASYDLPSDWTAESQLSDGNILLALYITVQH